MKRQGRPRTSRFDRKEQLRRAKRGQRERDANAGLRLVQLKLPDAVARKLAVAARAPGFGDMLDRLLGQAVIRISDYPFLKQIAWNRADDHVLAREAWGLYERNWRFVDPAALTAPERTLIEQLKQQYGAGILHA
ncbi:MAG TPA: hypothetical protein VE046_03390 [Steroidobacteraceae bacterium]|nr:hypothetical protein [Steroidobacteraceae bacterium]